MSDVFISYERATEDQARIMAEMLRGLGYGVWRDDELPAHRAFSEVITERLDAARAVLVLWSAGAARSDWVRAEADRARKGGKLVQVSLDGALPPLPFDQTQCADLAGWVGDPQAPGWRKVIRSLDDLLGRSADPAGPAAGVQPERLGPALALPDKPSIAVLPFANLSGDADQDYFADGLVEEIVTALSRIRSIFVVAAGSSLSLRGRAVAPQEAAASLGVRYVLEGSVRTAGGRVRIAVKLVDALDRAQIWAERFEDDFEDVFALQDRVALAVAGVIEPRVQHAELRRASSRRPGAATVFDLYLKALSRYRTAERAGVLEALDLLDRAIGLDPAYAPALGLAAMCHRDIVLEGWSDEPAAHRTTAIDLAARALRAGGDDAEVLAFAGAVLDPLEGDAETVTRLFDRAVALNPGSATAWLSSGMMRLRSGDPQTAADHIEASMRLDPLSPLRGRQLHGLGAARFEQGRFAEALALLKEADRLLPLPGGLLLLLACHGHLGQRAEAEAMARLRNLEGDDLEAQLLQGPPLRQPDLCRQGLVMAGVLAAKT